MNRRFAWGRITFILAGVVLFVVLLYIGPPPVGQNSDFALRMLANALSILAGFLIAVIVMLGDPRSLYRGNWRIASAHQREIRHALNRTALLFCTYLVVIAFIFAASLLEAYTSAIVCSRWMKPQCPNALNKINWLDRLKFDKLVTSKRLKYCIFSNRVRLKTCRALCRDQPTCPALPDHRHQYVLSPQSRLTLARFSDVPKNDFTADVV